MRWLRQERGFTLIELAIVMAITGAMLAVILVGRGLLFQTSAFTGAMDDAQNTFRQIQNEANQAVSLNAADTGQSAEVIFGRLATLTKNSSTLQTWTLVGAENNQTGTVASLVACDERDMTLPDGVVYQPNSGSTNTSKSVVFTRQTDQTSSYGQVFVAPDGASAATPPGVTTPVACPTVAGGVTTPLPPDQAPGAGLVSDCDAALGESDTRTGTGNSPQGARDICSSVVPLRPALTVTDAEGTTATGTASAPGTLTTSNNNLPTVTVTLPLPSPEPNQTVFIYDNGVKTALAVHPVGNTATFSYPIPVGAYGTHDLTATWDYGSSNESLASYAVDVTYKTSAAPTTCVLSETTPTTYECGLVGKYYRGSAYGQGAAAAGAPTPQATPQTVAIDGAGAGLNIGEKLGGGASAYDKFLPTLESRTGQQIAQTASVTWTGQIYLAAGSQPVCLQSDNVKATLTIGATNHSGSPSPTPGGAGCVSVSGGTTGAWDDITIKYPHSSANGEGTSYVRLVTATASTTPASATLCDYVEGIKDQCINSTSSSDITTCLSGTDPSGLPQSGGSAIYTCKVTNLVYGSTYTDIDGSHLRYLDSPAVKTTGPPANSAGLTASYYAVWPPGYTNVCPPSNSETVDGIGDSSTPATWAAGPPGSPVYANYLTYLEGKTSNASSPQACYTGYLQIPTTGDYQFCLDANEYGEFYWSDTNTVGFSYNTNSNGIPHCTSIVPASAGQHPILLWLEGNSTESGAGFEVTIQQFDSSGKALTSAAQIPDSWYTTTNTYVAAGPAQTQLPGYQQIVQNIEKAGQRLPATPSPVAQAKSNGVLQKIAQAITPPSAYAAAGDSPGCDNYILDPYNYLNTCSAFDGTSATSIILAVPGDSQTAHLHFNSTTGTISWSDN